MHSRDGNLIKFKNYYLPAWLFYFTKCQSQFISPAATFNPVTALADARNPWQTITSPSSAPKPKALVLE
jgi:hypothetical protein